jgi:hypothetical protein
VPDAAQQTLRIEAQVLLPPSEERAALDSMNQFAQILAHHPALLVAIERPPLDTRPNVKLSGKTGAEMPGTHAKFVLQLTTKP